MTQTKVISGNGSFHTARPGPKKPKAYNWITFQDICRMVKNPVNIPKSEAPWAIFSTTGGELAREHKFQREHGRYFALVADLDEVGSLTALDLSNAMLITLSTNTSHLIYSTKSATAENNKSRIIVPLAVPVSGADYEIYQEIFWNVFNNSMTFFQRFTRVFNSVFNMVYDVAFCF